MNYGSCYCQLQQYSNTKFEFLYKFLHLKLIFKIQKLHSGGRFFFEPYTDTKLVYY